MLLYPQDRWTEAQIQSSWPTRFQSVYDSIGLRFTSTLVTRCQFKVKANGWIPANQACSQALDMAKFLLYLEK